MKYLDTKAEKLKGKRGGEIKDISERKIKIREETKREVKGDSTSYWQWKCPEFLCSVV